MLFLLAGFKLREIMWNLVKPVINRDYAATLAAAVKNDFWGLWARENPPKFLFWKPNPFVDGILAQLSLKKQFFPEFWACPDP
ncbi:MAG: hypothetical protein FJ121_11635 [Deltaproteobacteria bacterium]|nr:hypothetical protein [Deltaproteobacteria bacterium]